MSKVSKGARAVFWDNIKLAVNESLVRLYDCVKTIKPKGAGYLAVTNKRLIFLTQSQTARYESFSYREMPIERVTGIRWHNLIKTNPLQTVFAYLFLLLSLCAGVLAFDFFQPASFLAGLVPAFGDFSNYAITQISTYINTNFPTIAEWIYLYHIPYFFIGAGVFCLLMFIAFWSGRKKKYMLLYLEAELSEPYIVVDSTQPKNRPFPTVIRADAKKDSFSMIKELGAIILNVKNSTIVPTGESLNQIDSALFKPEVTKPIYKKQKSDKKVAVDK